ncbi:hypothetical protein E6C60_4086 [Paenibacillus algicola]|uniref:Uncharacterized protein n=1 Tax=Paenibacillus algicola TaxID=2565926 RepID=A0A4P8XSB5_9BACL|nr:hypothetical protein [Paenibacillus algicola]QCT04791.1 hypothetical protein E6C60_4086 [Paenibacillus algicola]
MRDVRTEGEAVFTLVSAHTRAGLAFVQTLAEHHIPVALLNGGPEEWAGLASMAEHERLLISVNAADSFPAYPPTPIGSVFLFENSLPMICSYLQSIKGWTGNSIYVITEHCRYRTLYSQLGADYVIYSQSGDVSFLLDAVR